MDDAQMEELLQLTRDVRFLLWVSNRREVQELVEEAFEDADQRKAFRLLADGKSYREIASKIDPSYTTVGGWVRKWRELGLVEADDTVPTVNPETLGI